MIRRLLVLVAPLLLVTQAAFGATLPIPASAVTAHDVPAVGSAGGGQRALGAPSSSSGSCTVSSGPTGALLSSCPTAGDYADVVSGLQVAMGTLRGAADTGGLHVTSDPAGATVSVNGVDSGVTPLDLPVPPGTYLVRISADGYVPFSHIVAVAAGVPTNVSKTLDGGGTANVGSYQWVKPAGILSQLGSNGFADGSFDITGYVRDKDGADYVSFVNTGSVTVTFDAPTEFNSSFFADRWLQSETKGINTSGIARSTDDGASWTVLKTWSDSYTARTWTSDRFIDRQWSAGSPGSITDHWLRVSYHQWHEEQYYLDAMVPRPDGGISVYLTKITWDQPQEIVVDWDNLPSKYCRDDDLVADCLGIDHPARYLGTPFTVPGTGEYKSVASPEAMARWGVSQKDLATYNAVRTWDNQVFNTSSGGQTPISTDPFSMTYEGSYKDSDYFLALNGANNDGDIYVAHNGGLPTLLTTYNLGADAPTGNARSEGLLIGQDGTLYVLDHNRGNVYRVDNGTVVPLGTSPPDVYDGLFGPGYTAFNYLSAAVDSAGNVHAAFRAGVPPPGERNPTSINVYYEFFPRQRVSYDSVAIFTGPDCAACDAAKAWLTAAGVTYRENPADLPSDVAGSVSAEEGSKGFPVVARLGSDSVVIGGATTAAISQLLGVTYPILVDNHPVVWGTATNGQLVGLQPDWVLTILEDDQPRIVVQRAEGVMAFTPSGGTWASSKVLSAPPPTVVVETTTTDGATTAFHPDYPLFPGGITSTTAAVAQDVPFNTFTKVSDLRFLYRGGDGDLTGQYSYTLNTTKAGATSDTYRVVEAVSQLIPAAAFYVALGADGKVTPVEGELAPYVKSQDVVTSNGYRFAKIVVDLRAQDETETDGNIPARTIGGAVTVDATGLDGTAESRSISLILLVENTRLRTYDSNSRAVSLDITTEAVHFTGSDEHWVVSNNTALPNTVSCPGNKSVSLPPNSATKVSAAAALGSGLGDCFAAIEVAPAVLEGCGSWDDAQLVLAAQTIDSLATSLPLIRSENVTNWELSFGARTATVYRLVSLDNIPGTPGAPTCATAVTGKSAAVVQITGTFLGAGEPFAPAVSIVDSGTTAIQTAAVAQPHSLAFEREWLTFEATYLEADLSVGVGDEALSSLMFLNRAGKRAGYQRQLLATEALLSCNLDGVGISSVQDLMARTAAMPDALRGTVVCLNSFALDPRHHWPEYNPKFWAGGAYDATFLGTLVDSGLAANPTLSWLAAVAHGTAGDYGSWVAAHAKALAAKAVADADLAATATDFELDDYGRLATAASRDLGGLTGPVLRAVAMAGQLERSELKTVLECVKTMTGATPLAKLVELTSVRAYTGGIPCIDARTGGQAQTDHYQMLALGLRSGTFSALYEAAGRDLDLVNANLDLVSAAIDQVTAAEGRWPAGTTLAAWSPGLPALDRLEIALRQLGATVAARGQQVSVRDAIKGLTECGIGFVKSLPEGFLIIGLSGAAALAGPTAAAVGGVLFLGFGTSVTFLSAKDLANQWTSLDLTAKTASACGAALNAAFAAKGASEGAMGLYRTYRSWSPSALRASPPRTIDITTIQTHGTANGLSLEEQGAIVAPMGETIAELPVVAPAALDPALEAVIGALPDGPQQAQARAVVEQVGYNQMTPLEQSVVQKLLATAPGNRALVQFNGSARYAPGSPEYKAWQQVGGALLTALDDSRPKSLSVQAEPPAPASPGGGPPTSARVSGADSAVLDAAGQAAQVQEGGVPPPAPGTPERVAYDTMLLSRQPFLLEAVLGSERLAEALRDPSVKSLYTPEEAAALLARTQGVNPAITSSFFAQLSGGRFVTSLRTAVAAAADAAGLSGSSVAGVEAKLLPPGTNKVGATLTVHLDGGGTLKLVVLKGAIAKAEAAVYGDLGPKEITPRLLAPLLENVDGPQALMITEYAPSTVGGDLLSKLSETSQAPYASAIGSLIAKIWLKTQASVGGVIEAGYNRDLHHGNINVDESVTPASARVVDFDPTYTTMAPEDGFWLADLFIRHEGTPNQAQEVFNYTSYLDGIVAEFATETGSPAAGYDLLRRMGVEAATPAGQAKAGTYEPILPEWDSHEPGALSTLGKAVSDEIKAYLGAKGQSLVPGLGVALGVARSHFAAPAVWVFAALPVAAGRIPRRRDQWTQFLAA